MNFHLGPYQKGSSSRLKIESGNYPGHGKIPEPPAGARIGYSILDDNDKWIGFVELTYPFHKKPWPKNKAYIGVGVLPEYRGHGLARRAILEMMASHPEIKEWIWSAIDSNEPSLKLGEQLGFKLRDKSNGFTNMIKTASLLYPKFPRTTKLLQSFSLAIRPKPGYSISRQLAR